MELTVRAPAGLAVRTRAALAVDMVRHGHRPLEEALDRVDARANEAPLEPRDRAFLRLLSATVLRRHGEIDALLARLIEKPLPPEARALTSMLAVGVAQLLFLETPPHAAIDLAVRQCKGEPKLARYAGLVNAVLRRVARDGRALVGELDAAIANTPPWLWQRWAASYGPDVAHRIGEANLGEAALDIVVKENADAWAERLDGVALGRSVVRLAHKGRVETIEGYAAGAWWVQDFAATLPVAVIGAVAGLAIADLCAAPGGKTAQLAMRGARVTAVEQSPRRAQRLRENLERLSLAAEIVTADARRHGADASFDAVLLDAPCLATGTIRRHPDLPFLKRDSDLATLTPLQDALIANAARVVRPGGVIVYCTCSLEPEEGPARIAAAVETHPGLEVEPIDLATTGIDPAWITVEGYLRTFPFHSPSPGRNVRGMDGFFAAALRRRR